MTEGYGPNAAAIEGLARDGATLIVTVDCGTTSFEALGVAGPLGADVVVVDHHQADERLPEVAALINPNRQDDLSGPRPSVRRRRHLHAAGGDRPRAAAARALPAPALAPPDLLELARPRGAGHRVRRGAARASTAPMWRGACR